MDDRSISFKAETRMTPELYAFFAKLATTRACRTCDYGNSPDCGHAERAKKVCSAPVGDFDCAVIPCLGACSNPGGDRG